MRVYVMNQSQIEGYAREYHNNQIVVISITSHSGRIANIKSNSENNILDILFLTFDDVDTGENAVKKSDAFKIKQFLDKYKDIPEIIVNCEAGQSRSAGVAGAILKYLFNDDSQIFNNPRYTPNRLVYRTVLSVLWEE